MWQQLLDIFEKSDRSIEICKGNIAHGIDEIHEIGAREESVLGAVVINTSFATVVKLYEGSFEIFIVMLSCGHGGYLLLVSK